ncbi:uncharacterized protein RJT21DRAFT_109391 [Scheffersomyces amazonensis]|uniref:uncharacterized protein n=1 Tax=Scheffersomyces amazonensis TaxID=1078765 RepID=UPI00315D1654
MDNSSSKNMDDLASLFLPDILHPMQATPGGSATGTTTKFDTLSADFNLLNRDTDSNTSPTNANVTSQNNPATFTDFLHNNNFINNTASSNSQFINQSLNSPMPNSTIGTPLGHSHHYNPYMPFEPTASLIHHYQYQQQLMGSGYPQYYQNQAIPPPPPPQSSSSTQLQSNQPSQQHITSANAYMNTYPYSKTPSSEWYDGFLANSNSNSNTNLYNQSVQGYDQSAIPQQQQQQQPTQIPQQQQQQQNQFLQPSQTPQTDGIPQQTDYTPVIPKKKKVKAKKIKDLKSSEYEIDYKPNKLRQLLDLKKVDNTSKRKDYKIVDKDNNNVNIDFNGFLNGRFITNDNDNIYYLLTKKKGDAEDITNSPDLKESIKEDPKVISCYRRNYIQIAINMNINGFKNKSKLLKLQTSEYGYTITRVIKYFKIEISANISNKGNVPIFIKGKPDKKLTPQQQANLAAGGLNTHENKDDIVQPTYINSREHIVILNDEAEIDNGQIDKYFIVKKIQFKNATPNNGNLAFQNYYHFNVKFSCVVADLYYDDYVDDELNNGLNGNSNGQNPTNGAGGDTNEIVLFELVSEPITVRGRNPSFYAERKDITIKGRSISSKKSFKKSRKVSSNNILSNDEEEEDYDYQAEDLRDHEADDLDEEEEEDSTTLHGHRDRDRDRDHSPSSSGDEDSNTEQGNDNTYTTTQSALDLKSVNRYKYFPISNVYYLPPINVVYFPHRAHQYQQGQIEDVSNQDDASLNERRKSSNVYFK